MRTSLALLCVVGCLIALGGCAPKVDSRWAGLPPLAEAPDTTLPAELRTVIERAEANPNSADAQLALAAELARRRLFPDAIAAVGNALAIDPSDQRTVDLLMLVAQSGDEPRALLTRLCSNILARNPRNRGALWALGELGMQEGRLDESRVLLERAWKQKPRSWRMAISLARLEALQLNRREALKWSVEAARLAPDNAVANAALADVYLAAGDVERAYARATRAAALAPEQAEPRVILGRTHLARRDPTSAAAAFRRAIELAGAPTEGEPLDLRRERTAQRAHYLLGQTYVLLGRDEDGAREMERAFDIEKRGLAMPAEARVELAIAYQRLGHFEDAISQYLRIVETDNAFPAALNNLAFLYAEKGERLDKALEYAKSAVDLTPSFATHDTLGWVHFRRGEYVPAIEQLETARKMAPDNPEILRHLGLAYSKVGRAAEGRETLETARRLATGKLRATIEAELAMVKRRAEREQ